MTDFHVSQCPNNLKCMSVGLHPTHLLYYITKFRTKPPKYKKDKHVDKTN